MPVSQPGMILLPLLFNETCEKFRPLHASFHIVTRHKNWFSSQPLFRICRVQLTGDGARTTTVSSCDAAEESVNSYATIVQRRFSNIFSDMASKDHFAGKVCSVPSPGATCRPSSSAISLEKLQFSCKLQSSVWQTQSGAASVQGWMKESALNIVQYIQESCSVVHLSPFLPSSSSELNEKQQKTEEEDNLIR